jgi:hypothetical protein
MALSAWDCNVMASKTSPNTAFLQFCKWSVMSAAVFWMVVYLLSEAAEKLPNFVYVNF